MRPQFVAVIPPPLHHWPKLAVPHAYAQPLPYPTVCLCFAAMGKLVQTVFFYKRGCIRLFKPRNGIMPLGYPRKPKRARRRSRRLVVSASLLILPTGIAIDFSNNHLAYGPRVYPSIRNQRFVRTFRKDYQAIMVVRATERLNGVFMCQHVLQAANEALNAVEIGVEKQDNGNKTGWLLPGSVVALIISFLPLKYNSLSQP